MTRTKDDIKRRTFTTRLNPALLDRLKHLSVDVRRPVGHLLEEAIEFLLKKYQKK